MYLLSRKRRVLSLIISSHQGDSLNCYITNHKADGIEFVSYFLSIRPTEKYTVYDGLGLISINSNTDQMTEQRLTKVTEH